MWARDHIFSKAPILYRVTIALNARLSNRVFFREWIFCLRCGQRGRRVRGRGARAARHSSPLTAGEAAGIQIPRKLSLFDFETFSELQARHSRSRLPPISEQPERSIWPMRVGRPLVRSTDKGMTMIQGLLVSYGAISAVATIAYLTWGWALAERRTMIEIPTTSGPFRPAARHRANGGRSQQVSRSFATSRSGRRLSRRAHLLALGLSANSPGSVRYLRGGDSWY